MSCQTGVHHDAAGSNHPCCFDRRHCGHDGLVELPQRGKDRDETGGDECQHRDGRSAAYKFSGYAQSDQRHERQREHACRRTGPTGSQKRARPSAGGHGSRSQRRRGNLSRHSGDRIVRDLSLDPPAESRDRAKRHLARGVSCWPAVPTRLAKLPELSQRG